MSPPIPQEKHRIGDGQCHPPAACNGKPYTCAAGPAVAYADVLHILAYLPWPRGRPLASYGLLYLARDPTNTGVCWQRQLQKIVTIIVNVNVDF